MASDDYVGRATHFESSRNCMLQQNFFYEVSADSMWNTLKIIAFLTIYVNGKAGKLDGDFLYFCCFRYYIMYSGGCEYKSLTGVFPSV